MRLDEANGLGSAAFLRRFGEIAEHSPWVAERAMAFRPFASREDMIARFQSVLRAAPREDQLALIRAHPDLATRAGLAASSRSEQAGVGLDQLTEEEFSRFTDLNTRYRQRFGFPFIFAVRGATKGEILAAFEARILFGREEEFWTALEEVARIIRFRLEDAVDG